MPLFSLRHDVACHQFAKAVGAWDTLRQDLYALGELWHRTSPPVQQIVHGCGRSLGSSSEAPLPQVLDVVQVISLDEMRLTVPCLPSARFQDYRHSPTNKRALIPRDG